MGSESVDHVSSTGVRLKVEPSGTIHLLAQPLCAYATSPKMLVFRKENIIRNPNIHAAHIILARVADMWITSRFGIEFNLAKFGLVVCVILQIYMCQRGLSPLGSISAVPVHAFPTASGQGTLDAPLPRVHCTRAGWRPRRHRVHGTRHHAISSKSNGSRLQLH